MPYRIQLAALLTLALTTSATATISLPTIAPVPIHAGILITDGGGATLDNFVSQDLIINTTNDWTTAAIVLELTAGSIYQEKEGVGYNGVTLSQPDPALFGVFQSSEFDTYIFDPHGGASLLGPAGDLPGGGSYNFDNSRLDWAWNSPGSDQDDIGPNMIGRFTLSDDAQGTWSLAVTEAFNPHAKFLFNPIVNGQMMVDPLYGDLNFDGFVGIEDLNSILGAWNQSVTPGDRAAGDPSGDGFVGIEDLNITLGNWNAGLVPLVPGSSTSIERDLDGDGFVGIDDQNILLSNWNLLVPPADPRADPSGDGFVGISDKVTGNWNAGTPPAPIPGGTPPAVVPEPVSLSLLGVGCVSLLRRRA